MSETFFQRLRDELHLKEPPPEIRRDVSMLLSMSQTAAESISFHLHRKPMSDRQVQIPVCKHF